MAAMFPWPTKRFSMPSKARCAASRRGRRTSRSSATVPDLVFDRCSISGIVTTVGGDVRTSDDEAANFGLGWKEAERLKRSVHLGPRHVVRAPRTTTADLR